MKNLFKPTNPDTVSGKFFATWFWLVVILAIWLAASFNHFIPSPKQVITAWVDLVTRDALLYELYISFITNIQALGITLLISLCLSYAVVIPAMRPLIAFCSKARFFGLTGFIVLFTLVFGGGHWLKVALLVFGMSVFFITSLSSSIMETPLDEYDYAKTLRLSDWEVVREVIIFGKFDHVLEITRQNAAIGWMMLTMVEGLARAEGGLGALMLNENKHFKLDAVFAVQITVLVVGILQDISLRYLRTWLCPYTALATERK